MVGDLRLMKSVLALILTAAAAVTVNAQITAVPQTTLPQGHCTGGPFTLTAGEAKFHVALDDNLPAPSMRVTLRFYDADGDGTAVASRTVTLPARKATTLGFRGSGLFWVQASFDLLLDAGARRETVGSVELHDVDGFRAVIPVKCTNGPNERIV